MLTEPANVAAGMGIGAPGMGMGIGMGMPLGGMPPDPLGLMTQGLPFPVSIFDFPLSVSQLTIQY